MDVVSSVCVCVMSLYFSTGDKVETFPVLEIDQSEIVDTNGAGDAFVGGTVLLNHKDILSKAHNNFKSVVHAHFLIMLSFIPPSCRCQHV